MSLGCSAEPLATIVAIYVAICFGVIAKRNGRNPILFGILSIISPVNLVMLGMCAFKPSPPASRA